jgi:nucleotide-binding universal stress UspA family protein
MTKNILFPVRPDRDTAWVVSFLAKLRQREPVFVHLLSVQMPLSGHVRMFFSEAQVRAFHEEDGEKELAPVRKALDQAGIPYVPHMVVGHSAETIATFAREYNCHQVVMGPALENGFSDLVLGSLTRQVEHLLRSSGKPCEVL